MYTYIKNEQLFVLNPLTGRVYRIGLSLSGEDVRVVHYETMTFQADSIRLVKENNAKLVRD